MFESGSGCDVAVVLEDGNKVPVHKFILMARSPVFRAMISYSMTESNTNEVIITDFSPEVVRGMLHFMYSDTFDKMRILSTDIRCELLLISKKYEVQALYELCEDSLLDKVTVE